MVYRRHIPIRIIFPASIPASLTCKKWLTAPELYLGQQRLTQFSKAGSKIKPPPISSLSPPGALFDTPTLFTHDQHPLKGRGINLSTSSAGPQSGFFCSFYIQKNARWDPILNIVHKFTKKWSIWARWVCKGASSELRIPPTLIGVIRCDR